jgi:hypothetical protein
MAEAAVGDAGDVVAAGRDAAAVAAVAPPVHVSTMAVDSDAGTGEGVAGATGAVLGVVSDGGTALMSPERLVKATLSVKRL